MAKMKVAQVSRPGGPIELVERDVPQPGRARFAFACKLVASATAMR